jgi:hypothetical protein
MNIAFLAPGFLKRLGGGTAYVSHAKYSNPTHDRKPKQQKNQKKPQMNGNERKSIASRHYECFDFWYLFSSDTVPVSIPFQAHQIHSSPAIWQ